MMDKWRKITVSVLVVILVLPIFSLISISKGFAAAPEIPDYTGTTDTPHPITNKYELASIGSDRFGKELPLDGNYMQTADITFTDADFALGGDFYDEGKGWKPIGGSSSALQFKGTYDGGNFAIKNIYINRSEENYVGIFSRGGAEAKINNLGNYNGNITGKISVGGIAGGGFNLVENCYNTGNITAVGTESDTHTAAGIIGANLAGVNASIKRCYNAGKINSGSSAAGIIGLLSNINYKVENCYNKGEVVAGNYAAGIITSIGNDNIIIENCYNTAKISGKNAGGIAALNNYRIQACFNIGEIIGTQSAGGIAALSPKYIYNSYNTGYVQGASTAGGIIGSGRTATISDCYNRGRIEGNYVGGISGDTDGNIHYCYNAGQVVGISRAGSILAGNTVFQKNNCFDREVTQLTDIEPGSQGRALTTEQMTGINAVTNMGELITRSNYIINLNGYPELRIFRESDDPFIRDSSSESTQIGNSGGDNGGSEDGNGQIIGTIQPTQLKAVVPTIITFEVDPSKTLDYAGADGDDSFISPSFAFRNESNAPLQFSIESITAKTDMPTVVNQDTYTDDQWQNLNRADTNDSIAFGFLINDTGEWVNATTPDGWYGSAPLNFGTLGGNSSANLHLKGKYGLNWGNALAKQITYDVVYKVELTS